MNANSVDELFQAVVSQLESGIVKTHYEDAEIEDNKDLDKIVELNKNKFWTIEWQHGYIGEKELKRSYISGYVRRDISHRLLSALAKEYGYYGAIIDHFSGTSKLYNATENRIMKKNDIFITYYVLRTDKSGNLKLIVRERLCDYGSDFVSIENYYGNSLVDELKEEFIEVFIVDSEFKHNQNIYQNVLDTLKEF